MKLIVCLYCMSMRMGSTQGSNAVQNAKFSTKENML